MNNNGQLDLGNEHPLAIQTHNYFLCLNEEGWGPVGRSLHDFTPCFMDAWLLVVALLGIIYGSAAIVWRLCKRQHTAPQGQRLRFTVKQALTMVTILNFAIQLGIQIFFQSDIRLTHISPWATAAMILALAIILVLQWLENENQGLTNEAVVFWLLLLVALAVKLHSLVYRQQYHTEKAYFATFTIALGLSFAQLIANCLSVGGSTINKSVVDPNTCPTDNATVLSLLTFSWISPLMQLGRKRCITEDDLLSLNENDTAKSSCEAFEKAWQKQLRCNQRPSLMIALLHAHGRLYAVAALFKLVSDIAQYIQPQLLRYLIRFVASYKQDEASQSVSQGAVIPLAMFTCAMLQTTMTYQHFRLTFATGMRIKGSLVSSIYRKAMKLSNEGRASQSTGDVVNYMALDAQRLQDLTQSGQQLWSGPFQIIICLISLYQLVGWSMLGGLAIMAILTPVHGHIARRMRILQRNQMKNRDWRSRFVNEIITNMKSIKLYGWDTAFMSKLDSTRNNQEVHNIQRIGVNQAFANFAWITIPFLVTCSTFSIFVLTQERPLTAEIVFPALTLFNLLTPPLAVLPMVISSMMESSVAIERLTAFLMAEEVQLDAVVTMPGPQEIGEETVAIRNGAFSWNRYNGHNVLRGINFTAYKGQLACIIGKVGAGKSSLLQSILGELWKAEGEVQVRGTVAYVAQQPWLLDATVKENILFANRDDPSFYQTVIKACDLEQDFCQLPDSDETFVGQRGISLSGGQKARIALARAVYSRADIYILDDVLSAVDGNVRQHIIDNVLGPRGLLGTKTKILATNATVVLRYASCITMLQDGTILEQGTFSELISSRGLISDLPHGAGQKFSSESSMESPSSTSVNSNSEVLLGRRSSQTGIAEGQAQHCVRAIHPNRNDLTSKDQRRAGVVSPSGQEATSDERSAHGAKTNRVEEYTENGKVKWNVYKQYAWKSNPIAVAVYFLTLLASQATHIAGSIWLKYWVERNRAVGRNSNVGAYIGIYLASGLASSLLSIAQTLVLWIFACVEASKKLHNSMSEAIFRSPMSFFDLTPSGQVLNRFCSDIYKVDEILPRSLNLLFGNLVRSSFTLIIISVSTPMFLILIIPIGVIYYQIQQFYLYTSRDLKRLDNKTRSPIYTHFQESLSGLSTIRALRQQDRFELQNELLIDTNLKAYFSSISSNGWLAIRLEFIGSLVCSSYVLFVVILMVDHKPLSAGMVGLVMSYATQITVCLNWLVRQTVEVETGMISVERILEYTRLPSERPAIIEDSRPPTGWPAIGAVKFQNYSTRYHEGHDLVLNNIQLDIRPREKIGVVGRTGAGKSSLLLALFRIIEPLTGQITVDGLNVSSIGLQDLRRHLSIIPQDTCLFEGTVRSNLDPNNTYDDAKLWAALEHACLKDYILTLDGGLEAKILEGGTNLSQGQSQLILLARAMLNPSNILVLDEATAAIDSHTDGLLQKNLRSPLFAHKTIITVAHRINTILDSDRIIVLEKGEVAEFGPPQELLNKDGIFYNLAKKGF